MKSFISSNLGKVSKPRFLILLKQAWRLFWSKQVPGKLKLIPIISLLYLISPIDVIPDVLVGLGQLDDLAVVSAGISLFVYLGTIVEQLSIHRSNGSKKSTTPYHKPKADYPYSDAEIIEGEIISD